MIDIRHCGVALAGAALLTLATGLPAQTGPVNGMRPADLRTHAIVDATVITAPGRQIEHATIIVRDGVIASVGADVSVPADARVWSAEGLTVYPGLIDAAVMVKAEPESDAAGAHWNARVHPELRMSDQPLPNGGIRKELRSIGFTVGAFYADSGVFRGSGVVVALADDAEHVLAYDDRAAMAMGFDYGGSWGSATYPGSLMGAIALMRQTLLDARWHEQCRAVYEAYPDGNEPPIRADALVALTDVVNGEQRVVFEVDDEHAALRAVRFAREFDLDLVLLGSGNEFRRLQEIRETGRPIIIPLKYPDRPKVETLHGADRTSLRDMATWEQAPTNARRLAEAEVPFAITTHRLKKRGDFHPALRKAVEHGLSEDDALAALTTAPAELLGLSHVLGTIEPGKAANFVIVDGSLFEKSAKVRSTWINGRRFEITEKPRVKLVGAGTLEIVAGASLPVEIDTTKGTVAVKQGEGEEEKTVKAKKVVVQNDQVSFMLDGAPFETEGLVQLSGVVTSGRVVGTGMMPDGGRFEFTIAVEPAVDDGDKTPDVLSGEWTLEGVPDSPHDPPASMTLSLEDDGTVTGTMRVGGEDVAITTGTFDADDGAIEVEFPGTEHSEVKLTATLVEREIKGKLAWGDESGAFTALPVEPDKTAELPPSDINVPLGAYGRYEPTRAQRVVVRNAVIWTSGPDGIIEDATMVVDDGRITAIGRDVAVPGDALVIDAEGRHVTPGLIDCHSHTGINGGVNEWTQANTAEVRIGDCVNPDDVNWYRQLAGGLTAANQLHGSANPIGGQNSVVKLKWGHSANDFRVNEAIGGIKFALGENVKRSEGRYPDTRMGVETFIRDAFTAAADYKAAWDRYLSLPSEERKHTYPPQRDIELDTLVEIINGERIIHCHSYRQDEILMLIRVADDFGFTIGTFQHVLEGYKVAEAIAEHGAGGSSFSDWWAYKVEVMDAIPYNGALMTDVGVVVSFNSDSNELARRMNTEASKAVRYGGLEPAEALKLVTINPARQLRIDDRTGSLEVGKDADFVIWSDDPLSTYARCEQTWIEGERYFDLEEDLAMREAVREERQRLIQKILAQSVGGGARGGGARAEADTAEDRRPAGRLVSRLIEAKREWMAEQVRLGANPEDVRPGECGCNDWWWNLSLQAGGAE